MAHGEQEAGEAGRSLLKALDRSGWGLFFIWVGVAFLAQLGWGVGLLGVGVIMLAEQAVRRYLRAPIEGFGVVVGLAFALAGSWEILGARLAGEAMPVALMPAVSILIGVALVVSAWRRGRQG